MSAYIVFARDSTRDRAELETYWSKIKATMEGHPIRVLAAYGTLEVLESGPAIEGAVIAEFPTMEAAKAWFYSPGISGGGAASPPWRLIPGLHHRRYLSLTICGAAALTVRNPPVSPLSRERQLRGISTRSTPEDRGSQKRRERTPV